jgi:hypothetical protein
LKVAPTLAAHETWLLLPEHEPQEKLQLKPVA